MDHEITKQSGKQKLTAKAQRREGKAEMHATTDQGTTGLRVVGHWRWDQLHALKYST